MKRFLLFTIIVLQFVRLASPMIAVVDIGNTGAGLDVFSAMTVASSNLLAQLHPVKSMLKLSASMADTNNPSQPIHKNQSPRPIETTLIISSSNDLVKTNTPLWLSGLARNAALAIFMMLLLIICRRRGGIVLCRIQHLFARAREGICAVIVFQSFYTRNPC